MSLLVLAATILLGAEGAAPEFVAEPGSTHGVLVESAGHPESIEITGIIPSGQTVPVAFCPASTTCAANVTFPQCGTYVLAGVIAFPFGDPGGTGPYVNAVAAAVVVVGCDIFEDGFETGTAGAWSEVVDGHGIFADGFEDGTTDAWSATEGG